MGDGYTLGKQKMAWSHILDEHDNLLEANVPDCAYGGVEVKPE
jgi:hypothetical protein